MDQRRKHEVPNIEKTNYFYYYRNDREFYMNVMKEEAPPFDFKLKAFIAYADHEAF